MTELTRDLGQAPVSVLPARPGFVLFDGWDVAGPGDGATWSRTNPWTVPTLLPDRRIDHLLTG